LAKGDWKLIAQIIDAELEEATYVTLNHLPFAQFGALRSAEPNVAWEQLSFIAEAFFRNGIFFMIPTGFGFTPCDADQGRSRRVRNLEV